MKKIWNAFMKFLNDRGWSAIPNWVKHLMLSFFMVILFFGIPAQWFSWHWNHGVQLFIAAALAWGIGIWYEFRRGGNKSHLDVWTDFAGVVIGVLFCLGIW